MIELYVLKNTQYFWDTCWINFAISKNTVQHRGFAFITTPDDSHDELLKLNGIEFQVIPIVVEITRSRSVQQNHVSLTQHETNTEFLHQSKSNIVLFPDSISRGIKF